MRLTSKDLSTQWSWLPLWLILAMVAMFQHGPMPMFSTRTLSVAWEMWQRHSFMVPYLNGVPYSDKPPLLFWLIQLGWLVGGVGDVWPRVLEVVLGGTQLVLLAGLARRLFPEQAWIARGAPWTLLAFSYGFLFGLQVMYEVLLASCVLAALLALAPGPRREAPYFGWFALAVGIGLLAKGPVMLLHVAFPWLLGPQWNAWARRERRRWYVQGLLAMLAALACLLAWALTAAHLGGASYREQLLFHQTAGRVVDAFAHAQPAWWYLTLLPALIFPFALWPRLWIAIAALRRPFPPGIRFLFAWLGPVLLTFSMISGKQAYYLLPEYGGFALLMVASLSQLRQRHARWATAAWLGPWPLALLSLALAIALLALPLLAKRGMIHGFFLSTLATVSAPFALIYVLLGLLLLIRRRAELQRIALAGLIAAVTANGLFSASLWPAFDVAPAAAFLSRAEAQNQPIANLESYDGQFHFLGRLSQPIQPLHDRQSLQAWTDAHPNGLIISYPAQLTADDWRDASYVQPFRGVWLTIWPASKFSKDHADHLDP